MARGVAAMDVRLMAALASEGVNVSALCREHGISRETFYAWRRRYRVGGLGGLETRSRAPRSSPQRIGVDVEEAIVGLRKELAELGVDAGAGTIQWHLARRGMRKVPSQATIWRTLTRRGFVTPAPRKRPTSSYRRFEASAPNELWQTDTIDWPIATGPVKIFSFLDDHSRVALRVKAVPAATSEATWEVFCEATELWGVPLGQLSDNGLNFSGKLRGHEVHFERQLRAVGVVAKTSRPFHPQTCGKVERFQQTLKKWLRRRRLAATLTELQAQLDAFVAYYNHQRPHRGIGNITPSSGGRRFRQPSTSASPYPAQPEPPTPSLPTTASSASAASPSPSAANGEAAPPASTTTTLTPQCSSTTSSSAPSNSTQPGATNHPDCHADDAPPNVHCQRCPATSLSDMSRDTTSPRGLVR
jgi:transposase InsO family protein